MTKNSISLYLCIYNLDVLNYNQMKLFIQILTRHPIILVLFLNFACLLLIEPENARVGVGSDVFQSTQTQINKETSVRSTTSEKIRLKFIVVDICKRFSYDIIMKVPHFRMIRKWPLVITSHAKH